MKLLDIKIYSTNIFKKLHRKIPNHLEALHEASLITSINEDKYKTIYIDQTTTLSHKSLTIFMVFCD